MNKAKWPAFWFLLPAALLFIVFFYWPLLQNLYLSFFSWNMISPTMKYVGLSNYSDILGSRELYKIIGNTIVFVLIMLLFNFVLPYFYSFILGHLLQRHGGGLDHQVVHADLHALLFQHGVDHGPRGQQAPGRRP